MPSKRTTVIFLSALLLLVLLLAIVITLPFLKPFAFAVILAVVFYPLHERVLRLAKQRHGIGALISTFGVIVLFGVPAFIIATLAANEALNAAHYLSRQKRGRGRAYHFCYHSGGWAAHFIGRWVKYSKYDLRDIVSSNAQKVSVGMFGFGAAVLGNLARFTVDSLITFVILFFLFREGQGLGLSCRQADPAAPAQVARLYQNISDTDHRQRLRHSHVGAAQGMLTGIAMRIVGMPSSLLLGLAAGFASIIPVVGSSLIWAPARDLLAGYGRAVERRLSAHLGHPRGQQHRQRFAAVGGGGRVELHPMVLLFFILGGVEAFGFLGLFLGPVVASVLAAVFSILREELASTTETTAELVG